MTCCRGLGLISFFRCRPIRKVTPEKREGCCTRRSRKERTRSNRNWAVWMGMSTEAAERRTCALEGEAMTLIRVFASYVDRLLTDRRSETLIGAEGRPRWTKLGRWTCTRWRDDAGRPYDPIKTPLAGHADLERGILFAGEHCTPRGQVRSIE